jgi:Transposase domain (DUF772)
VNGAGREAFPGQPTVLQMVENLTDRQAADAVRDKISWKYALGLGLDDEGFDPSVALNLIRLHAYWNGNALDRTRTSHLARLEHALAA